MATTIKGVYRQRHPEASKFYQIIEKNFEEFIRIYPERFESRYGYYRPVVTEVIYKYLDCGDLSRGFARIRCGDCGHEFLLAHSCKCRYFCPSCHQKRIIQLGEHLGEEVLEEVPHRQIVFCIPKMLRIYFRNDRKLLGKLSQCAYRTLLKLYQAALDRKDVVPGVVISIQTFGDLMNIHPHLHAMVSDGCFDSEMAFYALPSIPSRKIEEVFSCEVFRLLLDEGKITEEIVRKIRGWRHSGFSVHQEVRIDGQDRDGLEGLVQYIGRAPLSEKKMVVSEDGKSIIYHSKMNSGRKRNFEVFDPLEWLAAITAHVPNKGEHMIRYYGYYSNKSRGLRKKRGGDKHSAAKPQPNGTT
ncbi:MAG: transposase [bacterium]|nr:transposase [bacterium]